MPTFIVSYVRLLSCVISIGVYDSTFEKLGPGQVSRDTVFTVIRTAFR